MAPGSVFICSLTWAVHPFVLLFALPERVFTVQRLPVVSCSSVCPSVKRLNCDKTKESSTDIRIPYERPIHLVFQHKEWLMGDVPFYLKFWRQTDPVAAKTAIFNRYSFVAPQPLDLAKKVQLSLTGNRLRAF